jgi:DNA-binding MarR family transcriptional regulator
VIVPRVISDRPPFVPVPNAFARDPTFSDKAFRLDVLLGTWANHGDEDQRAWPSLGTLAEMMGCHPATVRRALTELVDRGRVQIESGKATGEPNLYHLLDPEGHALVDDPLTEGSRTHARGGRAPTRAGVAHPRASNKNQKNKNQEQEPRDEEIEELSKYFAHRAGKHRGKDLKVSPSWHRDMDLLHRRGDPSLANPEEVPVANIKQGIDYLFDRLAIPNGGGFCWADVIRSPASLREHWEQLRAEHRKTNGHRTSPGQVASVAQ